MSSPRINNIQISDEFREAIKVWIGLDKQYDDLNKKANKIKEERDKIGEKVLAYLKHNNLTKTGINIADSRLTYREKYQYSNLSIKFIDDCLKSYFGDEQKAKEVAQYIAKQKTKTKVPYLDRRQVR